MISATGSRGIPVQRHDRNGCGGARVLDLAICMILAVTIVGLLMLAL